MYIFPREINPGNICFSFHKELHVKEIVCCMEATFARDYIVFARAASKYIFPGNNVPIFFNMNQNYYVQREARRVILVGHWSCFLYLQFLILSTHSQFLYISTHSEALIVSFGSLHVKVTEDVLGTNAIISYDD